MAGKSKVSPLVDIVFSCVFQDMRAEESLREFLNSVLRETDDFLIDRIEEIRSQYSAIGEDYKGKSTRLDVLVKTDEGARYNLEVQLRNNGNFLKRELYYGAEMLCDSLGEGEDYTELPMARVISILDFDPDRKDGEEETGLPVVETHEIVQRRTGEASSGVFKIHHIILPRIRKALTLEKALYDANEGDKLPAWLYAFTKGYRVKREMKCLEEVVPGMDNFSMNYARAMGDTELLMKLRLKKYEMLEENTRKREMEELRRKAEAAIKEYEDARREYEATRKEYEDARKESKVLKKEAEAMKKEYEDARKESEAMKKESEAMKKESEAMKKESEAMKKESEAMKKETEVLKSELGARDREIEALRKEVEKLKAKL